ncbi:MAG: radical SAM protein, partial [Gammaproteobacteria bacterium]|nr:radical SAM protein [Gammaproteobacteria bacterium]
MDRNRLIKICKEIVRRDIDVKWMCQARVDNVDQEILEAMKKAGCHYIKYGVESGSQEMLDAMKKGITLEKVRKAFKLTRKVGIKTQAFFLLGLPWETRETV